MTIIIIKVDKDGDRRTLRKIVDADLYFVIPRVGETVKVRTSQEDPLIVAGVQHDLQAEEIEVYLVDRIQIDQAIDQAAQDVNRRRGAPL